jgi:hypothetical protein
MKSFRLLNLVLIERFLTKGVFVLLDHNCYRLERYFLVTIPQLLAH